MKQKISVFKETYLRGPSFSKPMYFEALKQTRASGAIFIVLAELIVFFVIATLAADANHHDILMGAHLGFSFLLFGFAILLPLIAFRFLNKRGACDIMHTIPHTRTSLFLSFFAAALTWIAAGIVVYHITIMLVTAASPDFPSGIGIIILSNLVIALLISSASTLAACVAGSTLSAFTITCVIIAFPSLMHLAIGSFTQEYIPVLPYEYLPGVLSYDYNLFYNAVNSIYNVIFSDYSYNFMPLLIFTLFSLCLSIAALLSFQLRRSESAGSAAINRPLQASFRLMFSMLFCILPCMNIISNIGGNGNFIDNSIAVTFFVAAIIAFFVYEMVTTKTVRTLRRTVPTLLILLAMNLTFIGGVVGLKAVVKHDVPSASQIVSVQFIDLLDDYRYDRASSIGVKIQKHKYTGEGIKQIIAEALRDTLNRNTSRYSSQYPQSTVLINLKGRSMHRRIEFTVAQYKRLIEEIPKENSDWVDMIFNAENTSIDSYSSSVDINDELKETLMNELREKGSSLIGYFLCNNFTKDAYYYSDQFGSVDVLGNRYFGATWILTVYYGNQSFDYRIWLSDYLPKTANAYLKLCNSGRYFSPAVEYLEEHNLNPQHPEMYEEIYYSGDSSEAGRNMSVAYSYDTENLSFFSEVRNVLLTENLSNIDCTKPMYKYILDKGGNRFEFYINADWLPEYARIPAAYSTTPYYSSYLLWNDYIEVTNETGAITGPAK